MGPVGRTAGPVEARRQGGRGQATERDDSWACSGDDSGPVVVARRRSGSLARAAAAVVAAAASAASAADRRLPMEGDGKGRGRGEGDWVQRACSSIAFRLD